MRVRVLGSAAGGGFPQWNCGCRACRGVRAGTVAAVARTQESVAVSADGDSWVLLNASPEIRQQLEGFPPLHPRGRRHSPLAAVVLTSADLDHCLGLLSLREAQPLAVWTTARVRHHLVDGNAFLRALDRFPGQTAWPTLPLDGPVPLRGVDGRPTGLTVEAMAVPGKPPLYVDARGAPGDVVGLRLRADGARLAYFPGVGALAPAVRDALDDADAVFFDGTFWASDELPAAGLGTRRAEEMAHVPVQAALPALAGIRARHRILIHLNNTNPLLLDDSPERAAAVAAGWQVAHDGMELTL